jgi:hypothetical protein
MARLRSHNKRDAVWLGVGHAGVQPDRSVEARIGRRVQVQPNGCWLYNGSADDYGTTSIEGRQVRVHRFVYEALVGPIPEGHHVHHECETPGCCNPKHLRTMTPGQHRQHHTNKTTADFLTAIAKL